MHNILVVDDEPRNRRGIVNLLKEFRPNNIINEAKNGEQAMKYIEENNVDIVITDIRMPIMDGLELSERIMRSKKNIKVIILSAYAYFEYAKKAISIGAFDYLIKPVDRISVIETIERCEEAIDSQIKVLEERKKLEKEISSSLPFYTETQLNGWVKGYIKMQELDESEKILSFQGGGYVLVCKVIDYSQHILDYNNEEKNEIKSNIKYWLNELITHMGYSVTFLLHEINEQMILISVLQANEALHVLLKEHLEKLNEFVENIQIEYGLKASVGISNLCESINENINIAYEQARLAAEYKFYYEESNIIEFKNVEKFSTKQGLKRVKEEEVLGETFVSNDNEKVIELFSSILDKIVIDKYPTPQKVIDKTVSLIINLLECIQIKIEDEVYEQRIVSIKEELNACVSYSQLKNKGVELIKELIISKGESDSSINKQSVIMKKCIEYIDNNFNGQISLEEVADKFYFNPSYFSSYFKKYTGVNFSQYILNLRINKAKELLANPNLKVYEVASKVGYLDAKYFNRIFKNKFGVSPEEYRRLKLGSE